MCNWSLVTRTDHCRQNPVTLLIIMVISMITTATLLLTIIYSLLVCVYDIIDS